MHAVGCHTEKTCLYNAIYIEQFNNLAVIMEMACLHRFAV